MIKFYIGYMYINAQIQFLKPYN